MAKGQLSRKANKRQQNVENSMALIGVSLTRLEHDNLRIRQAIDRCGLADLLGPVIDDHQRISRNLLKIQNFLREVWEDGQNRRWS